MLSSSYGRHQEPTSGGFQGYLRCDYQHPDSNRPKRTVVQGNLQPTKAAEVIVFELNLTSATLGLDLPTT